MTWREEEPISKYKRYTLISAQSNQIVMNSLDFDVSTMSYKLKSDVCSLPSSGLMRTYLTGIVDSTENYLYVTNTGGELCIFSLPTKVFKALLPVFQTKLN